jgi:hypothetical protein
MAVRETPLHRLPTDRFGSSASRSGSSVADRSADDRRPPGRQGLFVHSPTAADDETQRAVDELGPVQLIVAPNRLHQMWLAEWAAAYREPRSGALRSCCTAQGRRLDGRSGRCPQGGMGRDVEQARARVRRVPSWDFEAIVLAHGRLIERDGRRVFREGMRWPGSLSSQCGWRCTVDCYCILRCLTGSVARSRNSAA